MRNQLLLLILSLFVLTLISCKHGDKNHRHEHSEDKSEHNTAHERDYEGGEGEEDGTMFGLTEPYDVVKNGVRLVLAFNPESEQFEGSMINTTQETVENARVEVHLSNGIELGPTTSTNLEVGQRISILLDASGQVFEKWSTHAEIGSEEHGHDGEEEHSHKEGEKDEHN